MKSHALAVLLICASVALASAWARVIPIFLAPDEDSHYDYALTLFAAGRPLQPSENVVGRDTHPVVEYLMSALHARAQRLDPRVPADPGYGSAAYFDALDARAPRIDRDALRRGPIAPAPYIGRLYPIGYYAVAAAAIALGDRLSGGSVVAQFFSARFLSVAMLAPTLLLGWLSLRELRLPRALAVCVLASVALLPMTAWMSGSVQPDNLAALLVAAVTYAALRSRRNVGPLQACGLGVLLALLLATKLHYFAAAFVAVAALVAARLSPRRGLRTWATVACALVPPALAYAVVTPLLAATPPVSGVCHYDPRTVAMAHYGTLEGVRNGLWTAFSGTFLFSLGLESFWLAYTPYRNTWLSLGNADLSSIAVAALPFLSCIVAALVAIRIANVWMRLMRVARRRSWASAARVATSNALVNGYLCLFVVIFAYVAYIGGSFGIQGRYWLPYAAAIFYCTFAIAPKALPRRFRRPAGATLIALVLGFELLAIGGTWPSIRDRFYRPDAGKPSAADVSLDAVVSSAADSAVLDGFAVDLRDATPVRRVVLRVDGTRDVVADTADRPDVECNWEKTLLRSGFTKRLNRSALGPGRHEIALLVGVPWSDALVDSGKRVWVGAGEGDARR